MTNFMNRLRQRLRKERVTADSLPAGTPSKQLVFEPLEPRLLLSADSSWAVVDAAEPSVKDALEPPAIVATLDDVSSAVSLAAQYREQQVPAASLAVEQTAARHEIVFVDTTVDGYEQLVKDFLTQNNSNRQIEVHTLDGQRDGIEQIGQMLAGYSELDAVHFISHGTTGAVQLGATWLDINSLEAVADSIAGWGAALTENADLLFYGCNVAASEEGRALLSALSKLTRADVAASVDPTGSTALGGDLDLEFAVGTIDAVVAGNFGMQQSWSGLLNSAPTLDNTKSPALTAINEDAGAPSGAVGTLVSQLVDFASPSGEVDNVTDPDAGALLGIAITAADTTNGTWWYSTNNGVNWFALGDVSDNNARLLAADADTGLYFQPNADYHGTMAAAITFHAWDQTSGTNGGTAALDFTATVLDQFSSVSYDNNNGTTNWTGNWVENDSNGGGVSGGRIQIDSGWLDIRADAIGDWIYREANLSAGTSATLSLDYNNNLGGGDSIVIQVSNNGGASYSTLSGGTFSSTLNTGSGTLSFDITPFISANTRVRFYVTTESANEHLYLDNVQISYSNTGGTTAFSTASDTASLTVNPVNDAPTASNMSTAETYTLNTPLNLADIVISDVDSANVTATLTLSDVAAGSLNTGTSGSVTSTYNAVTGVWRASGAIADVNILLANLTYTPSLLYLLPFTIDTSVDDGVAPAIAGSKSMTSVLLNLPPSATNLDAAETYTEDTPLNLTDIVISDIDSPNVTAMLTLSDSAAGSLNTGTSGSVTSTYNTATGVWSASGAIADVNTLLAGVTFAPALNYNSNFTIATSVDDGVAPAITGVKSVTGTAVNDAPTATNLSAAESYTEDTPLDLTDIVISDVDSANVTVTLTVSDSAAGTLSTATSGSVTSTFNAATGVWTASGAIADVNTLLAGVTFTPSLNYNSNFTIATSVDDGVAPAITGVKSMTGTAVNDAPTATNLSAAESYTEDTSLNLTDIVVSDVDSANVTVTLTLSDSAAGSLSTATSGSVTSTYNAATGVWTASGAKADVNTLLAGVTFSPSLNYNSNFTIATSVDDGVAAPITGVKNMVGTAQTDAPVLTNNSLTITEGGSVVLSSTDLSATDVDDAAAGLIFTVSSVSGGQFELVSSPGVAITSFTQAQISGGEINFVHDGGEVAPSYDVTVSDGVLADGPVTATISFTNQNDAPTLDNNSLTLIRGNSVVLSGTNLSAIDTDNAAASLTFTVSGVSGGQFELLTSPGIAITSFTQGQIGGGEVRFVHDGGAAAPSYSVTVSDGTLFDGPAAATINFINPNDTIIEPVEPPPLPGPIPPGPTVGPIVGGGGGGSEPPPVDNPPLTTGGKGSTGGGTEKPNSSSIRPEIFTSEWQAGADYPHEAEIVRTVSLISRASDRPFSGIQYKFLARDETPSATLDSELEEGAATSLASGKARSVLDLRGFMQDMDKLHDEISEETSLDKIVVGSTLTLTTGLSIGYLLWLIRGEILLSSLLASLPAWRLIDPLPVLAFLNKGSKNDENDGADDDSIESAVRKPAVAPGSNELPAQNRGSTYVKWRLVRQSADSIGETSL